jgi:hypothetical protein
MPRADWEPDEFVYYLAGGFYDDWRERLQRECGIFGTDSRSNRQRAVFAFVSDDLEAIRGARVVIARLCPPPIRSSGTAAEIGYAAALGRPILLIVEGVEPDAFLLGLAKRVFFGVDAFIAWFNERREKRLSIV